MNENEDSQDAARAKTEPGRRGKRPYAKPAVRRERVFETQALTCGKISGTQGACSSNRKLS